MSADGDTRCDVVVIGGGFAGATAARDRLGGGWSSHNWVTDPYSQGGVIAWKPDG